MIREEILEFSITSMMQNRIKFCTYLISVTFLSFLGVCFYPSLQIFTPSVLAEENAVVNNMDSAGRRVVVIRSQDIAAYNEAIEGFKGGCRCKGCNISMDPVYDLKGDEEEGKKVIQNIKTNNHEPKLILAVGVLAATLVKKQFTDIPIVYCMVVNHERFDLRGANITGISSEAPIEEQFAILKKFFGRNMNIGVIFDPTSGSEKIVSEAKQIGQKYDFNLIKAEVTLSNEITPALEKIINKIDALWIIPDYVVVTRDSLNTVFKMTLKKQMPTFGSSIAIVKSGALFSVSPDYTYIGLQASRITQMLLDNPGTISLGVEIPEKLKLALNTQTAKIIGINLTPFQSRPDVVLFP